MPFKPFLLTFLVIILLSVGEKSFAQSNDKSEPFKKSEFIIEKERSNQLPESNRLFKKAPIPVETLQTNLSLVYIPYDIPQPFTLLEHKIKVRKDQQELLPFQYSRYLALGHGNHWSPYFDLFIHNTDNHRYGYGVHLHHLSEGKSSYGEKYQQQANLHGKMVTANNLALISQVDYTGSRNPYSQQIGKSDKYDSSYYETHHQLKVNSQLHNNRLDTLNYDVRNEIIHYRNKKNIQENQTTCIIEGEYLVNEMLRIRSGTTLHVNKYPTHPTRIVSAIKPVGIITINDYTAELGLNLAYQNDTTALPNHFYLYPALKITYQWNKWLIPYLAISGNLQQQTWYDYSLQNPWLMPHPTIRHINQTLILSIGTHSNLPEQMTNHAGCTITNEENAPFFINTDIEPRQFAIQYDPSATTFKLFESFVKESFENTLTTRFTLNYFYYKLDNLKEPWHRPTYSLEIHNTYNFHEKILFKNGLYWLGGRKALDPTSQASKELSDIADLSLGIEYRWNERFSILLDMRNLLARDNIRYLHTPTDGVHLWLGVTYEF